MRTEAQSHNTGPLRTTFPLYNSLYRGWGAIASRTSSIFASSRSCAAGRFCCRDRPATWPGWPFVFDATFFHKYNRSCFLLGFPFVFLYLFFLPRQARVQKKLTPPGCWSICRLLVSAAVWPSRARLSETRPVLYVKQKNGQRAIRLFRKKERKEK